MMLRYLTIALFSLVLIPAGVAAQEVIVEGEGSESFDQEALDALLESMNVRADSEARIIVKKLGDGEVEVEAFSGEGAPMPDGKHHRIMKRWHAPMHHGPMGKMGRHHGRMGKMSEDAANCVLKNISKANSDAAAMAVARACRTLNPLPKGE